MERQAHPRGMDIRTETELCLTELVVLVDRGDFRAIGEAERIIAEFAALARDDHYRGALFGRLADKLSDLGAPSRCEADALLRAIKASVRRQMQQCFDQNL